jgi:hypothetical protein
MCTDSPAQDNDKINGLKLAGLTLSRTLLVRATHLAAHSRLRIAVASNDVPRIHTIVANDEEWCQHIHHPRQHRSRYRWEF